MRYQNLYNLNKKHEEKREKAIQVLKAILLVAFLVVLGIAGNVDVKVLGIK